MQRHEELCAQGEAIMQEYDAAYDLLPAWAQVGPEHMLSDGSRTGHRVGHPEVADPRPPQHEGYRTLIRPSFKNIKDRWDHPFHRPASTASEEVRRAYRKRRNDAIRKWIARKREQDAERAKVGLPELEGKADRFYDAAQTIQDELEAINDRHRQRQPDLRSPVSGTANRRRHRQA